MRQDAGRKTAHLFYLGDFHPLLASKPKKGYVLPKDTCEHLAEHVKLESVASIGNIAYLHKTRKSRLFR